MNVKKSKLVPLSEQKRPKVKNQLEYASVIDELQKISNENSDDHKEIKKSVDGFNVFAEDIKNNTKNTIDVLQLLRKDNNAHHEIIANLHKDSAEHLQIISGKKQVPLSIFAIVTVLLCGLLVASEVRYSGLDIEISTNGIHVSKGKTNSSIK